MSRDVIILKNAYLQDNKKQHVKLSVLLIVIYVFFSQCGLISFSNASSVFFYAIICLVPLLYFLNHFSLINNRIVLIFLMFDLILFFGSFYSPDFKSALISSCYRLGAVFIFIYFSTQSEQSERSIKYIMTSAIIHLIFVYTHRLFPSLMVIIANFYFDEQTFSTWKRLSDLGYYLGLARQAGFTTLFISPIVAYYYSKMLCINKGTIKNIFILCFALCGIILTAKRSSFGAVLLAVTVCMAISALDKKSKNIRMIFITISLFFFAFYILVNTNMGQLLLMKFNVYDVVGGSGREILWNNAIEYWKQSPWIGVGTNYFAIENSISAHNTYLQLLCENGIIGLTLFVVLVGSLFIKSVISLFSLRYNDYRRVIIWSAIFFQVFYLTFAFFESAYANNTMFILYIIIAAYPISVLNQKNGS